MTSAAVAPTNHAVVIGASMAGLLAARVLTDHFEKVTLIERDRLPTEAHNRQGVPQDRHLHVLLVKGEQLLDQWFPNMLSDLQQMGVKRLDFPGDVQWFQGGGYKVRAQSGVSILCMSRPCLESYVRCRVLAIHNLVSMSGYSVQGLLSNPKRSRVTGVQLCQQGTDQTTNLTADLVIDTTGRQSKSPQWLTELGYPQPETSVVEVNVSYTTRTYRCDPKLLPGAKGIFTLPAPPDGRRSGGLFPVEGDRWITTLIGWLGEVAPRNEQGFLDYAQSLPNRDIYNVIRHAQPLTDAVGHKFPANLRRHYERLSEFPQGYLVMGDAMCSFNPIYGQGMTASALAAIVLEQCLQRLNDRSQSPDLARQFFRGAAKALDTPWLLSVSEDFRFPGVQGPKPMGTNLINQYVSQIHQTTFKDIATARAFFRVLTLTHPPSTLFHPSILLRVGANWFTRHTTASALPSTPKSKPFA